MRDDALTGAAPSSAASPSCAYRGPNAAGLRFEHAKEIVPRADERRSPCFLQALCERGEFEPGSRELGENLIAVAVVSRQESVHVAMVGDGLQCCFRNGGDRKWRCECV